MKINRLSGNHSLLINKLDRWMIIPSFGGNYKRVSYFHVIQICVVIGKREFVYGLVCGIQPKQKHRPRWEVKE